MQIFEVRISPEYREDLIGIVEYLNKFSPIIGAKYYALIQEKVSSLKTMPFRCPLVRDEILAEKGFRWIFAKNYVIFFTVDERESIVYIERILYSRVAFDVLL